MKLYYSIFLLMLLIISCKSDDDVNQDNPNLIDPLVNITLNLNLPEYNSLKFPGNSIIISQQGIRGIVVYNVNNSLYTAFDLSDPNHIPNNCSRMDIVGIIASCPCPNDSNEYDIVTGQHATNENLFPMQMYRAQRTGDNIRITN
ncbi:hypothetical protein [Constantimarinum furrinae]|uniref:Rieske domain-containing protein n=1 Tax=Constantimarinum furrinae TaxID=2562285 RepID=A0A7G8PSD3_9FLAO|nr:hypothetical protein [Constantimarinum furrinae]QNJ97249.1 hypothetical protein ALE3EI_0672 [Constantimarinum furrinae]